MNARKRIDGGVGGLEDDDDVTMLGVSYSRDARLDGLVGSLNPYPSSAERQAEVAIAREMQQQIPGCNV